MTANERKLLVLVARLLAKLVLWKNIDGRNEALNVLGVADAVEKDADGVAGAGHQVTPPTSTDGH